MGGRLSVKALIPREVPVKALKTPPPTKMGSAV